MQTFTVEGPARHCDLELDVLFEICSEQIRKSTPLRANLDSRDKDHVDIVKLRSVGPRLLIAWVCNYGRRH